MTTFQKYLLVLIGGFLILAVFLFYWFQIRPTNITSRCNEEARNLARDSEAPDKTKIYDLAFELCQHKAGINP